MWCSTFFLLQNAVRRKIYGKKTIAKTTFFFGNTMVDSLLKHKRKSKESTILERLGFFQETGRALASLAPRGGAQPPTHLGSCKGYGVMTLH